MNLSTILGLASEKLLLGYEGVFLCYAFAYFQLKNEDYKSNVTEKLNILKQHKSLKQANVASDTLLISRMFLFFYFHEPTLSSSNNKPIRLQSMQTSYNC